MNGLYSIGTGQGSLLQTKWLKAFNMDRRLLYIRNFIENNRPTCEDIALHMYVSNATVFLVLSMFLWDSSISNIRDRRACLKQKAGSKSVSSASTFSPSKCMVVSILYNILSFGRLFLLMILGICRLVVKENTLKTVLL